jgi:CBS domain-containing protein
MWERDCGVVPVVDDAGKVLAMITDRDVCMAAFWEEKILAHIPVTIASSRIVYSVRPEDDIEVAEEIMKKRRVRRLPVTDQTGRLVGILSLSDIIRRSARHREELSEGEVVQTLSSIVQPHA